MVPSGVYIIVYHIVVAFVQTIKNIFVLLGFLRGCLSVFALWCVLLSSSMSNGIWVRDKVAMGHKPAHLCLRYRELGSAKVGQCGVWVGRYPSVMCNTGANLQYFAAIALLIPVVQIF